MTQFLWRITLLGGFNAVNGAQKFHRFRTQKTGSLLAFLALHSAQKHAREELADRLWPDDTEQAARAKLRLALHSLRRQLEPPGFAAGSVLQTDLTYISLNPDAFQTDVAELETALRDPAATVEALTRAVSLYGGPLLPGYYDGWIVAERERLESVYLRGLTLLVSALEAQGNWDDALFYAHQATQADPYATGARLSLLRLYLSAGQPAFALRQYREWEVFLRDELQELPPAEAQVLVRQAEAAHAPRLGRAAPPAAERETDTLCTPLLSPTLPPQFTRFFGREAELPYLASLLSDTEKGETQSVLVTLTGPGGSGKTRLALEVAAQLRQVYPNAIGFAALAAARRGDALLPLLADALGLPSSVESSNTEAFLQLFADALGEKPFLLILDNLEQIIAEGAALVSVLRTRLPRMRFLITSRRPLGLIGERMFPVLPMAVPSPAQEPEQLFAYPSVQLFLDRAQAMRPDFQITSRNAAALSELCARLEGIPLALELAASWVGALTPAQMLSRLETQRTEWPASRQSDREPRQRTLQETIAWSFALLPEELRRVFASLSVFRGGWTLEAAEAVCALPDALPALASLGEHSLIPAEEQPDGTLRWRMLESLREFAAGQLTEEDWAEAKRRHGAYCVRLVAEVDAQRDSLDFPEALRRRDAEQGNLKAAQAWLLRPEGDSERAVQALRFGSDSWHYWCKRNQLEEGSVYLEAALALPLAMSEPSVRNAALSILGNIRLMQHNFPAARRVYEEAVTFALAHGMRRRLAALYYNLSLTATQDAPAEERRLLELSRAIDLEFNVKGGYVLIRLGALAQEAGNMAEARHYIELLLNEVREIGNLEMQDIALRQLGHLDCGAGAFAAARTRFEECRAILEALDDRYSQTHLLQSLALLAVAEGDLTRAATLDSVRLCQYQAGTAFIPEVERAECQATLNELQAKLGTEAFEVARQKAETLTLNEAIALGLA